MVERKEFPFAFAGCEESGNGSDVYSFLIRLRYLAK